MSRQQFVVGLVPNQWVLVLQSEEALPDATNTTIRNHYHLLNMLFELEGNGNELLSGGDAVASGDVTIQVQDSDDGTTWTQRYKTDADEALTPGGSTAFQVAVLKSYVRVLAYSAKPGVLKAYLARPESLVNPDYQAATAITCATFCEQDCETGSETSDL
jgi:hypothetical protein